MDGASGASRKQTGPNCSELNWKRAGASTRSFAGDGSGALSLYEISRVLPGFKPIGPLVPTVRVMVWPSPSGERCSFSRVMPAESSLFH